MRYFGDSDPQNWTYRPTTSLPKRAILDSNVLLDACLVRDGLGIKAISWLKRQNIALYTAAKCVSEANGVLIRHGRSDLTRFTSAMCAQLGVIQVVDQPTGIADGVSSHDKHVANAAVAVGAFILTDDLRMLMELDSARIAARSTREVALEMFVPRQPPQEIIIFGMDLGHDSGHVFFKAIPDDELLGLHQGEYTVFENSDFGRKFLDASASTFAFVPAWGSNRIDLKVRLRRDTQLSGLLNYRAQRGKTNMTMKVNVFGDAEDFTATHELRGKPHRKTLTAQFRVMNSYALGNGWKGTLQHFNYGPKPMRQHAWRACRSLVGVAPPSLTMDMTAHAVELCEIKGELAMIPTLQSVMTLKFSRNPRRGVQSAVDAEFGAESGSKPQQP